MPYRVEVPAVAPDPPLLGEYRTDITFLGYIYRSMDWGGFIGLENAGTTCTWPIETLRRASSTQN
jgi:hypothetical protein